MKKIPALLVVLFSLCAAAFSVSAVSIPYTAVIRENKISFYQNNLPTATYAMKDQDLTLQVDASGDLLLCFYDKEGSFVGVTLGKQDSVTLFGSLNRLVLNSSLNRDVVLGDSCTVKELVVNAPVRVTIFSVIDQLIINGNAQIIAADGSSIRNTANNAGTSGGVGGSTDAASSNGFTFRTTPLDAEDGDCLRDLESALEDNVLVYRNNRRVYGSLEWKSDPDHVLHRDGSYRFLFTSEESEGGSGSGSIRVLIEEASLDLEITSFTVTTDKDRLSDFLDELRDHVVVYDDEDDEVSGRCRWVNASDKVRRTGWYEFVFQPKSGKYKNVRDEIKIIVDTSGESSTSPGINDELKLRIKDIDLNSSQKRLRDLKNKLENSVRAYDREGHRISGKVIWVDSGDTRVKETDDFEFRFLPEEGGYKPVNDWITLHVKD